MEVLVQPSFVAFFDLNTLQAQWVDDLNHSRCTLCVGFPSTTCDVVNHQIVKSGAIKIMSWPCARRGYVLLRRIV